MTGRVIFIGGVHGVGKGSLASEVSEMTGIRCFSASDLIKERKKAPVDHEKNVIDADKNQELLVSAVLDKVAFEERIILDGHFMLWRDNQIYPIPEAVFLALPIESIILVNEPPETIALRLTKRDGRSKPVEQIAVALNAEGYLARKNQRALGVPMLTVGSDESLRASEWLSFQIDKQG